MILSRLSQSALCSCCRNLLGTETEITSPSPRPGAHFLSQSELRAYFANFDNFVNFDNFDNFDNFGQLESDFFAESKSTQRYLNNH